LATAAAIAFPDGSITAKALQREARRGRLVIERIAGKDFTTLEAIERMRELCRVQPNPQGFTFESAPDESPGGSSSTADVRSALASAQMARLRLRKPSHAT
jgi:hypothetical protein